VVAKENLLEYTVVQSGESQLIFSRIILPTFAWSKSKPLKKPA
jgi:hypothetical protein